MIESKTTGKPEKLENQKHPCRLKQLFLLQKKDLQVGCPNPRPRWKSRGLIGDGDPQPLKMYLVSG